MTALVSYSTGTVSVAAGGTTVTGVGSLWSDGSAKPGDILQIGNFQSVITDVTDATHLVIPPWGGGAQAGVTYKIWQVSPQRFAGADALATVNKLVIALTSNRIPVVVGDDETVPDPSLGEAGQTAIQPLTGKVWVMSAGVWTYLGIYKGFNFTGAYNNATTYSVGDVMVDAGSSYIWINPTPGSGHTAPNTTYWQLLASIGNTGNPGPTGAGYGGTSATSLPIGTGAKPFTTQAGLAYTNGARVRATATAGASGWLEGVATYSGTTLTITADRSSGSGTGTAWNFNIAADAPTSNSAPTAPQGRITLTSGVAIMQSSVAAATRYYYTPAVGSQIPLYDGASLIMTAFAEVFQDTTDTTKSPAAAAPNSLYDLFAWMDGGTFRVTRGPAWTNDTTRSLALVTVGGFPLNAAAITNGPAAQRGTWVGTIGTNASGAVDWILGTQAAGGGGAVLGIHNAYNEAPVCVQIKDSNSWTYTYSGAAAWRAADNSSTFRCTFVRCKPGQAITADYNTISQASASSVSALAGVGLDSTTVSSGKVDGNFGITNPVPLNAKWGGLISEGATGVGIGRHYISAIEKVLNPGNSQYFGVDYSALTVSLWA